MPDRVKLVESRPRATNLARRRFLALLGAALPAMGAGHARSAEQLPFCSNRAQHGQWLVGADDVYGNIRTVLSDDGEFLNVVYAFKEQEFSLVMRDAYQAIFQAGGNTLGAMVLEYDYDFDDYYYQFAGDHAAIVNVLREGGDLSVLTTSESGQTASYVVNGTGFRDALMVMKQLHDRATNMLAANQCESAYSAYEGPYLPCFLTTATCAVVGLPDGCFELAALRRFRDRYMMRTPEGRAEVAEYYAKAPAIAARLRAEPGAVSLRRLYATTILPCAVLASLRFDRLTHRLYRRMMRRLAA